MTIETRLLDLWSRPPDELPDPLAGFRAVYTDPVTINGTPWPVADLVERARALHAAFTEHVVEVVDRVEAPGKLAIAFRHTARHTGVWRTPLGEVAPTGRTVDRPRHRRPHAGRRRPRACDLGAGRRAATDPAGPGSTLRGERWWARGRHGPHPRTIDA